VICANCFPSFACHDSEFWRVTTGGVEGEDEVVVGEEVVALY
jgi:hypothetical protein